MFFQKLLFIAFFGGALANYGGDVDEDIVREFRAFAAKYDKQYASAGEEHRRLAIFAENYRRVKESKGDPTRTYQIGINQFSDMTFDELRGKAIMDQQTATPSPSSTDAMLSASKEVGEEDYPPSFDWRDYGIVSPIKDQGYCGSCWSFAAVGAVESHSALRSLRKKMDRGEIDSGQNVTFDKLAVQLSEQQLVDCSRAFENEGCRGGLPSLAYKYIKVAGGLDTETEYPYIDQKNMGGKIHKCHFDEAGVAADVPGGSHSIAAKDEDAILLTLLKKGPITVLFEVVEDFQHYASGVYTSTDCMHQAQPINHAVLIVGYGEEKGIKYWLVKNSWGPTFGEGGYFKIRRGSNECRIEQYGTYPNMDPQPSETLPPKYLRSAAQSAITTT